MRKYSYAEIATDFDIWCEYFDPGANISKEEYEKMTFLECIDEIIDRFGEEYQDED